MLRAFWNSRSALIAQQTKLDSISNNLANVTTVGYKKEDVAFEDLVHESLKRKGYPTSDRNVIETGTGVKSTNWIRDKSQGALINTGNSTDFALDGEGEGFFRVIMPSGTYAYERAGNFVIDRNGDLADENGNRLEIQFSGEGRQILNRLGGFRRDNINVASDGYISVKDTDGINKTVGKINIYDAVGGDAFLSIGRNLYTPKEGVNVYTVNNVDIYQGFLENSNVDISKEMTDMIMTQRAFELSSRSVKTADEMWSMVNNMRK